MKHQIRGQQTLIMSCISVGAALAALHLSTPASADTLYAADYSGAIWKFDSSGHETLFVGTGRTPTRYDEDIYYTSGLAFNATGVLYASGSNSAQNGAVSALDSTGSETSSVAAPDGQIVFDKTGNIYVANAGDGHIGKISPTGTVNPNYYYLNAISGGLAIDGAGNLYVSDNQGNSYAIQKISTSGTITNFFISPDLIEPGALAFDKAGNLFVVSVYNGDIYKIDPSGVGSYFGSTGLNQVGAGTYAIATGMAFDSAGNLFVSEFAPTNPDTDDSVITEFTPGGVKTLFAAENGQRLNALAFAPEAPTETPEPGSLALTGASVLTGLGVFLRLRKRIRVR